MALATPVPDPASPIQPMRVLHTESSLGLGGQELRILDECAGLTARGHRVAVACAPDSELSREGPRRGVETLPIPIGKRNVEAMKSLVATLKSFQPHVINTHSSTDSWLGHTGHPLHQSRHPDCADTAYLITGEGGGGSAAGCIARRPASSPPVRTSAST
jgi:hypothetical protein